MFSTTLATNDMFRLFRSGDNLVLSFSPVPEPSSILTICALGLGAVQWRRRRRGAEHTAATAD
jgi:hypothetical protein